MTPMSCVTSASASAALCTGAGDIVCSCNVVLITVLAHCDGCSRRGRFLLGDEGAVDVIGQSDAAGFGKGLGVFVGKERAPHPARAAAAERAVTVDTGEQLVEHGVQEGCLEVDRA